RRRVENELREIENELRRVASIREEGIELGRVRQQRTSILTLLTKRFGSVDTAIEEALGDKTDMGELERLLLTAAMCGSLDEFKASL
ncbi:MAG: hypothetical protein Q4G68_14475, partial [Planctomycetia bacterium]|nr:hypothetical protein [Planctomycetia bacterium]